ncbi:MAG: nitrogenase-stabilizing/protective protein NifW [Thiohalocapsa sp.]|jgi:nitrogenase-stabilizing/protective protein|uniref:nitrogenase-stabilizing/protective protein NifW n=1 Tax=Thiohalocapsa sp. TaxID=2497641 RepID=UPI0025D9BB2E|nr:nitrogenase-stabilizing/protective protein NifW [Thiohalocapsa sp.]MCG6942803.1 nitrogenase-stabilizing/protective protein NifW [Thiohalocapsa sp.]
MSTSAAIPPTLEILEDALDELESAEDFLVFFGVDFDPAVVHVSRLHILQRFHDYLDDAGDLSAEPAARYAAYAALLNRAYQDFVTSDARTEKVFRVFRMHEPRTVNVGLDDLLAARPTPASHAS